MGQTKRKMIDGDTDYSLNNMSQEIKKKRKKENYSEQSDQPTIQSTSVGEDLSEDEFYKQVEAAEKKKKQQKKKSKPQPK